MASTGSDRSRGARRSTSRIPRHRRALVVGALIGAALGTPWAGLARAQDVVPGQPGIETLRSLIAEREAEVTRLQPRLDALEARADSLSLAKRRAAPGSPEFQSVSNQILDASQQITQVARQMRTLSEQLRDLRTRLFLRYNEEIPSVQRRIDELTAQNRTTRNSQELRRLVERLQDYVRGREAVAAEIEEAEEDVLLLDLVVDPTDGPAQLRVKEAIARDLIDKIDTRIAAIEGQIDKAVQRKRDLEEMRRLQQDIELWQDDQAVRGANQIQAILEGRASGSAIRGAGNVFDDPDARIRDLQHRRLELLDKRSEYESKARLFAERLRAFYR